jgi:hypothetical protein
MDTIVLLVFGILIALIIVYYIVNGYLEGASRIQYKSDLNESQEPAVVPSSSEYSYTMWINIASLLDGENMIISREGELKLSILNGNLMLTRNDVTYEIMNNFPMQNWVHVTITVENSEDTKRSFINAYIDGKMVKSYQGKLTQHYLSRIGYSNSPFSVRFPSFTLQPTSSVIDIGEFDAKLVGLKRWTYPLTPAAVANEYNAVNLQKVIGNYNVDISVLENEKLAKRFTVF